MSQPTPLSPAQRDALLSSPGPARFKHFIGHAADSERVWGLRDVSGWGTLADDSGAMGFPVWPHPDYATACATGIWAGHGPADIDLYEFIDKWLPDMAERKMSAVVFPIPPMKGGWMAPEELRACLIKELENYA